MKRVTRWLGIGILTTTALLAACSGGDKKDESAKSGGSPTGAATATATVEAAQATATQSSGQAQAGGAADCFTGLKTYRYSGSVNIKLPSSVSNQQLGDIKLAGSAVAPDRTSSKVEAGGQTIEVISIGHDVWMRQGNGTWEKDTTGASNLAFTPDDFCQTSPAALEKAGIKGTKDKVNGVDAVQYQVGKADLAKLGTALGGSVESLTTLFDSFDLGLWVTAKEQWPLKISLKAAQKGSDALSSNAEFNAEFNITDFNKSDITIDPPK